MKFLKITLILIMLATTVVHAGQAQQAQESKPTLSQQILQAKIEVMREQLRLTEPQMERFRPLYTRYERAVSRASTTARKSKLKEEEPASAAAGLTREQAMERITAMFDASQGVLDVKKEFMGEFAAILSPEQLMQFYRTESDIRNRVNREVRKRAREQEEQEKSKQQVR